MIRFVLYIFLTLILLKEIIYYDILNTIIKTGKTNYIYCVIIKYWIYERIYIWNEKNWNGSY